MENESSPRVNSRRPLHCEGLVCHVFQPGSDDSSVSRMSWRLSTEELEFCRTSGSGFSTEVEAEIVEPGGRAYAISATEAALNNNEEEGLDIHFAGGVGARERASGAAVDCDAMTWLTEKRQLLFHGGLTGSVGNFRLASPGLKIQKRPVPGVRQERPSLLLPWRGRVEVEGPAKVWAELAVPTNNSPVKGMYWLPPPGTDRPSGAEYRPTLELQEGGGKGKKDSWLEKKPSGQTRKEVRKIRGRRKLRSEGIEGDGKLGGNLLTGISLAMALAAPFQLAKRVIGLLGGPQMGEGGRDRKEQWTGAPTWRTTKGVAIPLGPTERTNNEDLSIQGSGAFEEGESGKVQEGNSTAEVEVNAQNGFVWEVYAGEVQFLGPLDLACRTLGAKVVAGGGKLQVHKGQLILNRNVYGTLGGFRMSSPQLIWKGLKPSRSKIAGESSSQLPRGLNSGWLVANKGLRIWKVPH